MNIEEASSSTLSPSIMILVQYTLYSLLDALWFLLEHSRSGVHFHLHACVLFSLLLMTIQICCYYGLDVHSVYRQSWFRGKTPDSVVLGLILTNVAVFMLWRIADPQFMLRNFTVSCTKYYFFFLPCYQR